MDVLISIKPQYVEKIVSGEKKYEFRKRVFDTFKVDRVYIYSSAPEKKIIGSFKVGGLLIDSPEKLWKKVKNDAGIDFETYSKYFTNKANAYAIIIDDLIILETPIDPRERFINFTAPQSYIYLKRKIEW